MSSALACGVPKCLPPPRPTKSTPPHDISWVQMEQLVSQAFMQLNERMKEQDLAHFNEAIAMIYGLVSAAQIPVREGEDTTVKHCSTNMCCLPVLRRSPKTSAGTSVAYHL